ncbi:50S ribosomal protein L21 [Gillisia limnaea]|uniref:Large ribosomal subunit protein bL21 n=1 Tax=Gillisia limnaea (strain DSM 15749 / LMG 21470 / R-8282) TaxID=865937 RepID=H2BRZ0_GILLR|nr:50S ribosomal protein L21 [Gillisia limnaea]EHQ02477.1 50S ribosomal protein L21 [Gillisia limnaea DSM 15749]
MYAIVEIAGQQFKVAKDQKVFVNRLAGEEGDSLSFDKVLLTGDGDTITLGAPAINGALVDVKITRHLKGDKVIVFKKKRRKGYRVKNGHRQSLTEISIVGITLPGGKKATSAKKEDKAAAPKAETKKTAATPSAKKEVEVSENLVSRAENRAEDGNIEINVDKLLHSIGTAPKSDADDLKLINGIGPVYEQKLNDIGIYTYEQISKLKAADREELSALEGITRDKIESDEWVKQAKELLKNK